MSITRTRPTSFWCDSCRKWMPLATDLSPIEPPACGGCGEWFTCGECGYEIDADGSCARPGLTPGCQKV